LLGIYCHRSLFEYVILISILSSHSIFITSRPELDIRRGMADLEVLSIEVQGPSVIEDIRCLIRAYLANDVRMKRWPENVNKEIIAVLTEKANGMSVFHIYV
jgi:hypothetical protein